MKLDEDLWAQHQYQVLVSFVHHLAYYWALKRCYDESRSKSEFWTRTIDAHLLRAIIDWCMVFGTDSSEIHWKKVTADHQARSSFRRHLLSVIGLTREEWQTYWSNMTTFRNNFAAHRIVAPVYPSVPNMDVALLAATAYDDWFRGSVAASFGEPPLRARYDRLIRVSGRTFARLISAGPPLDAEYEGHPPRRT